MPNYQALSNEKHRDKGWIPFRSYNFASKDAVAPLAISELTHAISSHPLCFVKHSDTPDAAFMLSAKKKGVRHYFMHFLNFFFINPRRPNTKTNPISNQFTHNPKHSEIGVRVLFPYFLFFLPA